ncbi:MAG: CHASE2 domain-containing protein [Burkholderiales bacterium]|nr:CHASE2 domain-containing protein [Burkholderiales bacterium]
MQFWHPIALRIGALPARRVTWALVALFSLWVLGDVFVFKLTGGLARSSFDTMVRNRVVVAAPDPRIVIIDIDEASLARMAKEFGRWPWPRDTLATVLEHIEQQQPAAIAWDILFSDADRLSPGGDAAFNQAVSRSTHSHFSIVRLPAANDAVSQITQAALPGLWVDRPQGAAQTLPAKKPATVALIAPALPAVAAAPLGYNNGYVDSDGVLRRYRYLEPLADGSAIQSLALGVARSVNPQAYQSVLANSAFTPPPNDELIAWRRQSGAYPRVSFADVFAQAEGDQPTGAVPSFAGKVVIIGSTAPSLFDIHPTPLSQMQTGVESLATAIDNVLHQRHLAELPRWLQAALAIILCIALALWVQYQSAASLAPALVPLPVALIVISYLSLNLLPVFLDLHLAAALALAFLSVLHYWSALHRNHWCSPPPPTPQPLAAWSWRRDDAWTEAPLDRLIDAVEHCAPDCRVVVCDSPSAPLRWPEFARFAAVVGPSDALHAARPQLEAELLRLAQPCGSPLPLSQAADREALAGSVWAMWEKFLNPEQRPS